MMSYTPKFGRVLIKREINEKVGSIYIPQAQQRRTATCFGEIIALGETAGWAQIPQANGEIKNIQTLKVGDKVIFGRHAGAWLDETYASFRDPATGNPGMKSNNDGTMFICQDADILVVVNEGEKA